jgi:hypothetical protein
MVLFVLACGCGRQVAPAPATTALFADRSPGERGCLLASTCTGTTPPSLSSCLTYVEALPPPEKDFPACTGAPTCAAYLDCLTLSHGRDYCQAHPGPSCDGDVAVTCPGGGGVAMVEDCARDGMGCAVVDGPAAVCTTGQSCAEPARSCAGGSAYTACLEVVHRAQRRVCPAGTTCDPRALSGFPCVPEGADCGPAHSRCDGDVRVWCEAYSTDPAGPSRESRFDCGKAGTHCSAGGGGPEESLCVPDGAECSLEEPARCVGDRLQYCDGGHLDHVDCPAEGLTRCRPGEPGREDHCE